MNLIEVSNRLQYLKSKLNLSSERRNDSTYNIYNWMEFSNSLNLLKDFRFLESQVDTIFSIDDNINIRNIDWIAKAETYKNMIVSIKALIESIDSCVKLIDEYTSGSTEIDKNSRLLNVKMPNIIDMKSMSNICDDIDIVFSQCPLIKDEVKFIGVEKGSIYFLFTTALPSVIAIGLILKAALDVQKKHYQNQMVKSKLETMKDIEGLNKTIIKKLDDEVEEYCKTKAMEIEGAADLDKEEQTRLILSIKTLNELIGKGVQMQCSLSEGEDDSAMSFPKIEEFTQLLETMKLIE